MISAALVITIGLLCFVWRLLPLVKKPHAGCDAYYFLLCREVFQKEKKIPIVLPNYYVLEYREQWYPPGFVVFLSFIPSKILDRYYWCVSPFLDSMICVFLFVFVGLSSGSLAAALFGSLTYVFSPAVIPETQSLTSRQLGALLMSISMVSGIFFATTANPWCLVGASAAAVLLLMTHKFSAQAWALSLCLMGMLSWNGSFGLVVVSGVAGAMAVSKGFYWKVLKSHWDYVSFWSRKWPYLGGHQIEDSPVYGKKEQMSGSGRVYRGAEKEKLRFVRGFLGQNPYGLIFPATLVYGVLGGIEVERESIHVAIWGVVVLGLGIGSYCVEALRGIGFGSQYGKLALPAGVICMGYAYRLEELRFVVIFIFLASLWQGGQYLMNVLMTKENGGWWAWDRERMAGVVEYVKGLEAPLIMCLPNNYCDLLVYHARIRVLWGGHGSPTANLEPLVPVLTEPVEEICRKHEVTHLLIDNRFVHAGRIGMDRQPVWSEGNLEIYRMEG